MLRARLERWAGAILVPLFLAAVALVVERRLAGGLRHPAGGAMLAAAGLSIALVSAACRAAVRRWPRLWARHAAAAQLVLAAAGLVAAIALSAPGSTVGGICLLWGPLVAAEAWQGKGTAALWWSLTSPAKQATQETTRDGGGFAAALPREGHVVERQTRTLSNDGVEIVDGWASAALAAGERITNLHLAFCPPLDSAPTITCRQVAGPPARVRVADAQPYGARIEVRLASPADVPREVAVAFSATAPSSRSSSTKPSPAR